MLVATWKTAGFVVNTAIGTGAPAAGFTRTLGGTPMAPSVSARGCECASASPLEITVASGLTASRNRAEKSALPW